MNEYNIFLHEDYGYRVVNSGFSISALVFNVPWFLIKELYWKAFLIMVFYTSFVFIMISNQPYYYQNSIYHIAPGIGAFFIGILTGFIGTIGL